MPDKTIDTLDAIASVTGDEVLPAVNNPATTPVDCKISVTQLLSYFQSVLSVLTVEDVSGTTYTLVDADTGKLKRFTNNSAITVTVPNTLATGFNCLWVQEGAGQITFVGSSLTVTNYGGRTKSEGQYAGGSLVKTTSGEARLYGQVVA